MVAAPVAQERKVSAEAYALYLWRDTDDVTLIPPGTGPSPLTTEDDLSQDWDAGVGAEVIIDISNMEAIGASFMYVRHDAEFATNDVSEGLSSNWSFTAGPGTFVPDSSFTAATAALGDYETSLIGGEVSYFYRITPRVTLLIGPRVAVLDEDINLFSVDEGDFDPLSPGEPDGQIQIDIDNYLAGIQVGVEGRAQLLENLRITGSAKGGVYANYVEKDFHYENEASNVFDFDESEWDVAGIVQGDLELALEVAEGVELFVGGTAMYLLGVATGPGNVPEANTASEFTDLDNDDNVLYVGGRAGLRVSF
ncbi:MAG: hypothetical protein IIA00_07125 [Proteobacteria bacterium]|nr:hypothetical protein [Pseudomonadota bacterium]